MENTVADGIPAYESMSAGVRKMRDFYAMKPDAGIYQREFFGFYSMDRWKDEGHIPRDATSEYLDELFGFDPHGKLMLGNLGWCEPSFFPLFDEKVLVSSGDYEIVQDTAGREVKCFTNRRSGFMPEYIGHPVTDMKSWEEKCLWRMDPNSPERTRDIEDTICEAKIAASEGKIIVVNVIGGYMYLRSIIGPVDVMYMLYDQPEVIHACMKAWFDLADSVIARYQRQIVIDELYFGEDICYNHGLLISEDMVREFLFPYYSQLLGNMRARQRGKDRRIIFHLDTDGNHESAIKLYREIGMSYIDPFEVASGCDVVRTGREYPDLLMGGGIDKRILAESPDAIDREIRRIMPAMKRRGGYIPTCDHGVPEEVSFENYMHFRKRMLEYA